MSGPRMASGRLRLWFVCVIAFTAAPPLLGTAIAQQLPLVLNLTTKNGTNPIYRPGEFFTVVLRANQPSYAQCYYSAGDGTLAMIFPNSAQSDNQLKPGVPVTIPPEDGDFKIRFGHELTFETIACFATEDNTAGWIPPDYSRALVPIPGKALSDLEQELLTIRPRAKIAKSAVTAVIGQ